MLTMHKIKVTRKKSALTDVPDKWIAGLGWEIGLTQVEALGKLLESFPAEFNAEIEYGQ